MKRTTYAYAVDLKNDPQSIAAYTKFHAHVWPEVLKGMERFGVTKNEIFLIGNHLFMTFESATNEPLSALGKAQQSERELEWEAIMRELQRAIPEAKPGETWTQMQKVFDFEEQIAQLK